MALKKSAVLNKISTDRKELVAMSRFFNNDEVSLEELIDANRRQCAKYLERTSHYLIVHDTSDLNYMHHSGKLKISDPDIGPTGHYQKKGVGFMLHPSLVVQANHCFPVGYANIKLWNRSFGQPGRKQRDYKNQAIEEKESYKWLEGMRQSKWVSQEVGQVTHVMDSDADMYELFIEKLMSNEELLVRSCQERKLEGEDLNLKAHLKEVSPSGQIEIDLKGNEKRKARKAILNIKFSPIKIKRPSSKAKDLPAYVQVNVVVAAEIEQSVPPGEMPVHWILLTTHEVSSLEQALQIIKWYTYRWSIEEMFATLKSRGLDIEDSQVEKGKALKKLTVMALQVALQILQLVKDRENHYAQKASLIFDEQAIVFLKVLIKSLEGKTEKQKNPFPPDSLAWAAWPIARMGGWKGYKSDYKPGPRTMKRGLDAFWDKFSGFKLALSFNSP